MTCRNWATIKRVSCAAATLTCLTVLQIVSARAEPAWQPSSTWLQRTDTLHVYRGGATTRTVQTLRRIDTEAGVEQHAEQRLPYSATLETLEVLEAWTLTPDGRRLTVEPERIRTLQAQDTGAPHFSDQRVKVVIFPAVGVGAQLHLRYRRHQHTPYFAGHASFSLHFSPSVRVEDARVELSHDAEVPLQVDSRGVGGGRVPPQEGDVPGTVRYAFRLRQAQAVPAETGRVDLADFAPGVHATTFADRAELASAYQAHARVAAEPTPAIRQLAAELTQGARTEREKVQRLAQWMTRHIRYVALLLGTGGYVPQPAHTVLEQRYGDCKGQVALLQALLAAVDIPSTPALVNAERAMTLPRLALLAPFDHVIAYVPSLDLYLDPTARFAPLGTLPYEVMDKPVLLTATGHVGRTPRTSPQADYTHTRAWMTLSPEGEVLGNTVAVMRGAEEVASRGAQFDNLGRPLGPLLREYLERFGETGTGAIQPGDPLDLAKPWQVESTFELDPVVNVPGPSAFVVPVGLAPGRIRSLAAVRPVQGRLHAYVCTSERHLEETELRLPPGVRIQRVPAPVSFARGALRYAARYRLSGQRVFVTREFAAERASHTCSARDDEDWAALWRVLQRDLRTQIFIR